MKPNLLHMIEMRGLQLFRPANPPGSTVSNGADAGESWKSYMNGTALSWYGVLRRASGASSSEPGRTALASRVALSTLESYLGSADADPADPTSSLDAGLQMEAALLDVRGASLLTVEDLQAKCGVLRELVASLPAGDPRLQAFPAGIACERR